MLVDLETLHVHVRHGLTGARTHGDTDEPQDLLRLLPRVECRPLVGAEDEHAVLERLGSKSIDRVGIRIHAHLHAGHVLEGEARQFEPRRGIEHCRLVAGPFCDEDEQAVDAEFPNRPLCECDVTKVRRIERAAEDRRRQSVTVSSPISTSAPGFAPTARSASSSTSRSGGLPTTRKPRSVRKMRYAPRPSGCGR
jgi:hypothetical protein